MGSRFATPGEIIGDAVALTPAAEPTMYQALCRYVDRKINELKEELATSTVKTVNGVGPDIHGNVAIQEGLPPWIGGETIGKIDSKSTDRDIRLAVEAMRVYLKQEKEENK